MYSRTAEGQLAVRPAAPLPPGVHLDVLFHRVHHQSARAGVFVCVWREGRGCFCGERWCCVPNFVHSSVGVATEWNMRVCECMSGLARDCVREGVSEKGCGWP